MHRQAFLLVVAIAAGVSNALGQTDEIQVYDAEIAAPGKFNLMLHNNFTPTGETTPAFVNAIVPDKSLNGALEWAFGVTDWFETGLYLPVYSASQHLGMTLDALKLRELFVTPNAGQRTFFYGVNIELSYNADFWELSRFTSEIRPIIGWHWQPVDLIINPILETDYSGIGELDFSPAVRLAYNVSPRWSVAVEEYADVGPLRGFHSASDQSHQLYGVFNRKGNLFDIECGAGFGLTDTSDKMTLKLMLSRDLN